MDTKKKEQGRIGKQKWFTGERWHTFYSGERGSPGGPIAIAELVYIIAEDMQHRGVTIGDGENDSEMVTTPAPEVVTAPAPAKKRQAHQSNSSKRWRAPPPT